MKTKGELLEHYSEKVPKEFLQFDIFTEGWDSVIVPNEDGVSIFQTETTELMTGRATIRILIIPGAKKEVVVNGLKSVTMWIEKNPDLLEKMEKRDKHWKQYLREEGGEK